MQHYFTGLAGIALILLVAVALSSNRRHIRLRVVSAAFAMQTAIAFLVLYVPAGRAVISGMSQGVANLLGYALPVALSTILYSSSSEYYPLLQYI